MFASIPEAHVVFGLLETICIAIMQIIEADELGTALSKIGSIKAVYGTGKNHDNLVDETILYN